ncbi:transaldolase [Alicyclobacillus contaminans]|uniref:Transaldolase n=1 Tax=Tetragenococcus osmophilus TaxID=526944 RepID=A0AA37XKL9_9ENTE|nr:transaldolase family protein [Tetragenococcus osmophilus]GMA54080.1 transaldolase [Alicyclobacillus contaminans]GMA72030.1 transaldolase [Tetragenococcus osmophilus]
MFLDTADKDEIVKLSNFDWIKGVTTNPTLIRYVHKKRQSLIDEIEQEFDDKKLFVQVQGRSYKEMEEDFFYLLEVTSKTTGLKVPTTENGLELIQKIKNEHPERTVLATIVYSVEQGYLAGLVGCDWIAPYVNRMENQNINPYKIVQDIHQLYHVQNLSTKIMGASFKNQAQIRQTLLSGADTVTVPPIIIKSMMNNVLAEESLKVFQQHAQEEEI